MLKFKEKICLMAFQVSDDFYGTIQFDFVCGLIYCSFILIIREVVG